MSAGSADLCRVFVRRAFSFDAHDGRLFTSATPRWFAACFRKPTAGGSPISRTHCRAHQRFLDPHNQRKDRRTNTRGVRQLLALKISNCVLEQRPVTEVDVEIEVEVGERTFEREQADWAG